MESGLFAQELMPVEAEHQEWGEEVRLHFAFARDRGVILEELEGQRVLFCRPGVTAETLLEVRRVAGGSFRVEFLDPEPFDERLMMSGSRQATPEVSRWRRAPSDKRAVMSGRRGQAVSAQWPQGLSRRCPRAS